MQSELARERQRRADIMRNSAWVPSSSPLVWVIYTSLLLGNIRALVDDSNDIGNRKDTESTQDIWTQATTPSSTIPIHETSQSSITEGMPNETYACGNKSKHCDEYCNLCGQSSRTSCFELSHDLLCYSNFKQTMDQFNSTDLCLWNMVQTPYNTFTECSEGMADCLLIPWPNPAVEDAFVKIHTMYFQNCVTEGLRDPPPSILFALVMTPICLIPAMVFLVVLKTKNGDGRS